ncbi:zinc-finger of the MIZ type in Nse subunit-domain-containing protein [Hypoxylon trugodes]|uniref:zinc-finger of the MIZ type in Nse subunit-domain-containing protein n=1 Tax=Hypoxylon trugodes TaxID=326681 RepID=UPI0021A193C1|nr:zinc-finger of the MIZ type in Nse subunit-domain-containing protein [Hypoxylon trugodes]KAI1387965.1 zinc-finger of the MIZ type in Nse subunit-domain-containing protein [Hypoxylon trugodes]
MPLLTRRDRDLHRGIRESTIASTATLGRHTLERDIPNPPPAELPPYEPLACPLSDSAIRTLAQLCADGHTRKYEEQLSKSLELLSGSVRDLNDRFSERKETLQSLQAKRIERNGENSNDTKSDREHAVERAVLELQKDVPLLTEECDLAVRSVIDLKVELEDNNTAMRDVAQRIEREAEARTRRRRPSRRNRDPDAEDETQNMDQDEDMDDAEIVGPVDLLKKAKQDAAAEYASKSLYEKYAVNNDYIDFKRLWHDAVHGADGKPLPDATKWFSQNGANGEMEDDEDEDLIVAEEHLDIHCPLSMVVMQNPYTSTKCKHTFEKESIVQFLRTKPGGKARCPQTGCNKEVSMANFQPDPVMLRRIKRQQVAQRAGMDDDDEDETLDGDGDLEMRITQSSHRKVKQEGRDRGRRLIEDIVDDDEEA